MSMIIEQEKAVERAITQTLENLDLARAAKAIDSLIFTNHVLKHYPENVSEAVRFHMETRRKKELLDDSINIKEIGRQVHQDLVSGEFDMRFFYPDSSHLVEIDSRYEALTRQLKEEGVIVPGMDSQLTWNLTVIGKFGHELAGDAEDYGDIRDSIHKNIKNCIPLIMSKKEVKASDLLRLEGEPNSEPLAILSNSHLSKRLSEQDFIKSHDISYAVKNARESDRLQRESESSFSP